MYWYSSKIRTFQIFYFGQWNWLWRFSLPNGARHNCRWLYPIDANDGCLLIRRRRKIFPRPQMLGSLRKVVRYPCPKSNLSKPAYMQVLKVQLLRIHKQLKFEGFRRISKDLKGFYSISTASFVVWIDFSAHNYLETLQDLRLGFPKCPYFWKSNVVATRDEPLKDVVGGLLISVAHFWGILRVPVYIFQRFVTSRHLIGFSKVRTFWKAKTQILKCLKVVMCRKRGPRDERYRWKSSKIVLSSLALAIIVC